MKVDAEIEQQRSCSSVEEKWLLQQSVVEDGQADAKLMDSQRACWNCCSTYNRLVVSQGNRIPAGQRHKYDSIETTDLMYQIELLSSSPMKKLHSKAGR